MQAIVATEPDNPYDPNAISVWIDGHKVGYFCKEDAQAYQPGLVKLFEEDAHVALAGVVTGGGLRDGGLGIAGFGPSSRRQSALVFRTCRAGGARRW